MSQYISAPTYGSVSYFAERRGLHVGVAATGCNRTGGYRTSLALDTTKEAGTLVLVNIAPAPGTIVTQVLMPFHATFELFLPESVEKIQIYDSEGLHQVEIQPGEIFIPSHVSLG